MLQPPHLQLLSQASWNPLPAPDVIKFNQMKVAFMGFLNYALPVFEKSCLTGDAKPGARRSTACRQDNDQNSLGGKFPNKMQQ